MLSALFSPEVVTSQKQEKDIDALLNLGKTAGESLREYVDRYWDTLNEIEGCIRYQKVAMTSFKNGLDESARDAYQDFYLHPPRIWMTSWSALTNTVKWLNIWPCSGSPPESPIRVVRPSITFRRAKERTVRKIRVAGYQKDYVRGPKPREFEASTTVFKEPLHELLKKIEHEPYFSYPVHYLAVFFVIFSLYQIPILSSFSPTIFRLNLTLQLLISFCQS